MFDGLVSTVPRVQTEEADTESRVNLGLSTLQRRFKNLEKYFKDYFLQPKNGCNISGEAPHYQLLPSAEFNASAVIAPIWSRQKIRLHLIPSCLVQCWLRIIVGNAG